MIRIWRGFHSPKLLDLVRDALDQKHLLVLVAPTHKDFSFLSLLPDGPVELVGDWDGTDELQAQIFKELKAPRQNSFPETPVLGVFTSGTTSGYSRLILYSKENLVSSLESIRSLFDCKRITNIFCFPQPTHIFGLALGYVQAILYDLKLTIGEGKYSRETQKLWFENVNEGTLTLGAPAHFSDLIASAAGGVRSVNPSYSSICGGASVSRKLWLDQRDILRIHRPSIGYGASEASPGVTHLAPGIEPLVDGEIGSPLPGVEVQIIPEHGFEFSGPNMCLAYVENKKLNFPKTILLADWVEKTQNGFAFRGRYSAILNRGGQKFSLERIEVFLKAKLSLDCIAVGVPEGRLGEELGVLVRGRKFNADLVKGEIENEFGFSADHILINSIPDLPLNQNFKPDRHRAKVLLFRPELPSPVAEFSRWLPHRDEAIWVDSVLEADSNSGSCEVNLHENKNYFSEGGLRSSSYIEWMAQSYGFVKAYQELSKSKSSDQPKRVFLVAVKDFELMEKSDSKKFVVSVRQTHQLGPMALVSAQVTDGDGKVVAKGELKLFAE